jgi:DNA-binding NarL/FixJ family response regulator
MLTVVDDPDQIFDAILAGAMGYLLKTTPAAEIIDAVREIHAGGAPITTSIARKVLVAFRRFGRPADAAVELSPRETRVLEVLAQGASYKEIAHDLGVSLHTIRTHAHNIYRKLQVSSRQEAVRKFQPHWPEAGTLS